MASFDAYVPILAKWEGGFVDNPNDPGGATNKGVTLSTYRQYFGADKTVHDLKNISELEWRVIMRTYWNKALANFISNQSIANIVVDFYINAGTKGLKAVQNAIGCNADGVVGKRTLAALNAEPQDCVFCKIRKSRIDYYMSLADNNPKMKTFLKGWVNRTNSFEFQS